MALVLLGAVVIVFMPAIMNSTAHPPWARASHNAKQIYLLMIEFDDDFGTFPNDRTAAADEDLKDYTGNYSNDYLGQFIAGGYVQSEEMFSIRNRKRGWKSADNDYSDRQHTLAAGECGFSYLKNLSTSAVSGTPLLMAVMTGEGTQFDADAMGGKAIVLRVDGVMSIMHLDPASGEVLDRTNRLLFKGGKGTPWENSPFVKEDLLFPK